MSTFSFSLSLSLFEASFLAPIMCRRSSELFTFDDEEAPDSDVKFLLLLEMASVEPERFSPLAIDVVDAPMFEDETSKLFEVSLLAADERFGEPERFCDETTFSFSFRYEVIRSWRKKKASASTVTKMWSSNSVMKLHSTRGFSSVLGWKKLKVN